MRAAGHPARPLKPYLGLSVGLHLGAAALAFALGTAPRGALPEVITVALVAPPAAAARGPGGNTAGVAAPPGAKHAARAEPRPPLPEAVPRAPAPDTVSLARKPETAPPARAPGPVPAPTPVASTAPPESADAALPGVSSAATGGPGAGGAETSGGSGAGGSASLAPAGAADAVRSYVALVRARIQAERRYSPMARRRGLEGVVTVRLHLDAAGEVSDLDVEEGAPLLLAKATQEAVKRAGPFPPPPDGLGVLRIPVRYRLTD
jgi:protein TonB